MVNIKDPKEYWDNLSKQDQWREYILPQRADKEFESEGKEQAQWLAQFIDIFDVVIDYGCGIGRITNYLSSHCKIIIGLDICDKFIELARLRGPSTNFHPVSDFATTHNFADFIFAITVLQHNTHENRVKILEHIHRLLQPGGMALFNFPQRSSPHYHASDFVETFSIEDVESYGSIFRTHEVFEGNLVRLKDADMNLNHEYFLKVFK